MTRNHSTRSIALTLICASALFAVAAAGFATEAGGERSPLGQAFAAIVGYESVLNARDDSGEYVAQNESTESLAARLTPYMVDDFIGVTGLGHATDVLGYSPTSLSRLEYAQALKDTQALMMIADQVNGGDGTYDFIHLPFSGQASGNVAYFTFNFEGLGSLTDADGERLPVELPLSLIDPSAEGSAPVVGRCICVCKRVNGEWKLASFYFVLTPPEGLLPIA